MGRRIGENFKWGKFVVNVRGDLVIGKDEGIGERIGGIL